MSQDVSNSIRQNMESKTTEELLEIWEENDNNTWSSDSLLIIKQILLERGKQLPPQKKPATIFSVYIENISISLSEKMTRFASFEETAQLREASLAITDKKIEIFCTDDNGKALSCGSIDNQDISRIKVKMSAIKPKQQLKKPAISGAISGATIGVLLFLKGFSSSFDVFRAIFVSLLMVPFVAVLVLLFNIGKVKWSKLAIITFDSLSGERGQVAIENEKVKELTDFLQSKKIKVESLL